MNKSIQNFRKEELKAIFRFIDNAYEEEIANILVEILVCHGLHVFDSETRQLKPVQLIQIGGIKIKLLVNETYKEKQ